MFKALFAMCSMVFWQLSAPRRLENQCLIENAGLGSQLQEPLTSASLSSCVTSAKPFPPTPTMLFYKTEMSAESVDLGHLKEGALLPSLRRDWHFNKKHTWVFKLTLNLIRANGSRTSLPGLKQTIPEKRGDMKISWNFQEEKCKIECLLTLAFSLLSNPQQPPILFLNFKRNRILSITHTAYLISPVNSLINYTFVQPL